MPRRRRAVFDVKGGMLAVGVSAFPDEIYTAPRSWTEKAYPKLIYYNERPKGGHFAAREQPKVDSDDIRAGLRACAKRRKRSIGDSTPSLIKGVTP